jgi:hypothetical protein
MNLARIGREAINRPYPTDQIQDCHTALLLFGAGFLGGNDGWHIAQAGLSATVVDTDDAKLNEMRNLYPDDWRFVCDDAFSFAHKLSLGSFDLVSVDPFTNLAGWCLTDLPVWTGIARKAVTLGTTESALDGWAGPPTGWTHTDTITRNTGIYWLVLRKGRRAR